MRICLFRLARGSLRRAHCAAHASRSRLHRSELAVPGSNQRMLEKAPALGADVVMLDLEDAVAPDDKERAREQVIAALRELDWSGSLGLAADQRPRHALVLPRHRRRGRAGRRPARHRAHPQGLVRGRRPSRRHAALADRGREAAAASDRHQRADRDRRRACTASTRSPPPARSGWRRWCSASPTTPRRCRATRRRSAARREAYSVRTDAGARALGRPVALPARADRGRRAAPTGCGRSTARTATSATPRATASPPRRAAVLGYEGKWAIHPSQVALANEVFTPDAAAAEKTRRIVAAMAEAAREGRGAVSLDGRLIDAASLRMAETLLHKLEQIEAREARAGAGGGGMTLARRRRRESRLDAADAWRVVEPRSECGATVRADACTRPARSCCPATPRRRASRGARRCSPPAAWTARPRAPGAARAGAAADRRGRRPAVRRALRALAGAPQRPVLRRARRAATASGGGRRARSSRRSRPAIAERAARRGAGRRCGANTAWRAHRAARARRSA